MSFGRFLFLLLISASIPGVVPHSLLKILPERDIPSYINLFSGNRKIIRDDDTVYCKSWSLTVETNDAGIWATVPERCVDYVKDYMNGGQYGSDSAMVSEDALNFAKTVEIAGDGKDVWVFDIDETLLSNLPYYAQVGYGSEVFNGTAFNEWADLAECPALPASLKLYKELYQLGFKLILLTGRYESQRNMTIKNLLFAGYSDWERLLLRGPSDVGTSAVVFKSGRRMQLVAEGYRIHGSSGDQWSDLMGSPMAKRSFKLPNLMYYIA